MREEDDGLRRGKGAKRVAFVHVKDSLKGGIHMGTECIQVKLPASHIDNQRKHDTYRIDAFLTHAVRTIRILGVLQRASLVALSVNLSRWQAYVISRMNSNFPSTRPRQCSNFPFGNSACDNQSIRRLSPPQRQSDGHACTTIPGFAFLQPCD